MCFTITQWVSLISWISLRPWLWVFYTYFSAILHFIKNVDSIKFISHSTLRWELVLRFFTSWRCETSWTTACLAKVHYLNSKMDKLELLNTTRSDVSSISAFFPWKTWLSSAIPDGVVDPQDYKLIQADRGTIQYKVIGRNQWLFTYKFNVSYKSILFLTKCKIWVNKK